MVLVKHPMPGHPTIWIIIGQGPAALAVAVVWTSIPSSIPSFLFHPLFGRRPVIDRNTVSTNQPNLPLYVGVVGWCDSAG